MPDFVCCCVSIVAPRHRARSSVPQTLLLCRYCCTTVYSVQCLLLCQYCCHRVFSVCCCVSIVATECSVFVAVSVLLPQSVPCLLLCQYCCHRVFSVCCCVSIVATECSVFVSVSVLYHRVYSIQCLLLYQFCCSTECTKFSVFVAVSVLLQHRVYRPFSVVAAQAVQQPCLICISLTRTCETEPSSPPPVSPSSQSHLFQTKTGTREQL